MVKKSNAKSKEPEGEKVVCRNRKARFNYEILESIEAGIVLTGTEVKSLRAGKASLDDSYAKIEKEEVWLLKADIPEYAMGNWMNHLPKRKRKLLLHRREIAKLNGSSEQQKGQTLIPLSLYFKNGRAKVELGVAKGKKIHDKRQTIKDRDSKKAIKRATGIKRK